MSVMFLGRQFFPHVIYFICVGLMADESSRIELILQNSFDACVLPQEAMCDLGFVVAKALSEYLLLIVALGFYPLPIQHIGNSFESVSVKIEGEYPSHDLGMFFYDYHLSGVLILEVTHRRNQDYPRFLLLLVSRADLL